MPMIIQTSDSLNSYLPLLTLLELLTNVARIAENASEAQEAPVSAATPAGAHIETVGETMQVDRNRMYRVKAVAELLDVHAATIYRAIERGELEALKIGEGSGTLRIPGHSLIVFIDACGQRAYEDHVVTGSPAAGGEQAGEVA